MDFHTAGSGERTGKDNHPDAQSDPKDLLPLALTMGDPAGIGPEILVRALDQWDGEPTPLVIGQPRVIERAAHVVRCQRPVRLIAQPESERDPASINVLMAGKSQEAPAFGMVSAAAGQAAYDAITIAIDLARSGRVCGIVTAPINKAALAAAGLPYPGHTEILASHGGASDVAMMLANDVLRTVLVTIHCSLRDAIDRIDIEAELRAIRFADQGARVFGIEKPRIAVAGLNPHAGENGLFGTEEIAIIAPAIKAARAEGLDVSGPWPGDTVFMQARMGRFDIVVAQYHDQGLIPVKYLGLENGVNVTLGLPFIRTSPDHGTGFDIAGKAIADPASFLTAMRIADTMARGRPGLKTT